MSGKREESYLHITNSNTVIATISYNLVLDFLPALHGPLDKYLRTGSKRFVAQIDKLLLIIGETTPQSTKSVCSTNDDRELNFLHHTQGLFNRRSSCGFGALFTNVFHSSGEELSVFGLDDGIDLGTQNLDSKRFKLVFKLDTDLECSLATKCHVDRVWALVDDDFANELGGYWEKVDFVRESLGGLDSGDIGVDEDCVYIFLFESFNGLLYRQYGGDLEFPYRSYLTAGVVELSGLPNAQTSTAQDEHLLYRDPRVGLFVIRE